MSNTHELEFEPVSYWGPQDLQSHFGSRITGELRRRVVMSEADDWSGGDELLNSSLDDNLRSIRSSVHPWMMGGEYLPPLKDNEVEIARVTLKSVTMDVFSIRARRSGDRIYYRLVDEYMEYGAGRFVVRPLWNKQPLTMSQLIGIIDRNGLISGPRQINFHGNNIDEVYNFATVSSEFYPDLAQCYDEENEAWRKAAWAALEEEELEDEKVD